MPRRSLLPGGISLQELDELEKSISDDLKSSFDKLRPVRE